MDRDHADDIFMNIESLDPAIARELKGLVFTFEDIPMLCERARALLFDKVPTDQLIMALRGADDLSTCPFFQFSGRAFGEWSRRNSPQATRLQSEIS